MTIQRRQSSATAIVLVLAIHAAATSSFGQPPPGGYRVNGVEAQFSRLQHQPDPIAWNQGVADDNPYVCMHYQGMARSSDPGIPYFFLTRSGNKTGSCDFEWLDDGPGELVIVKMASRNTSGERLRSNRLAPDLWTDDTYPPAEDVCVVNFHFANWCHAGCVQLIDNVLIVPLEAPLDNPDATVGELLYLDMTNPEMPVEFTATYFNDWVDEFDGYEHAGKIGVVAVTRDPITGKYLFLLTGGVSRDLEFWESDTPDLSDGVLNKVGAYFIDLLDDEDPVKQTWEQWQTMNFVRDVDDSLYLICADNTTTGLDDGIDWLRLFKVTRDGDDFDLEYKAERHIVLTWPIMGDFDAIGGVYVTPTGNLIVYSGQHILNGNFMEMGEIRSRDMTHDGTVGEGWVTLYDDSDGWDDNASPNRSKSLDYSDRYLEDWKILVQHDVFDDASSSVIWGIPIGRCARMYDVDYFDPEGEGVYYDLVGDGTIHWISDLGDVYFGDDDFNDIVSSVKLMDQAEYYQIDDVVYVDDNEPEDCLWPGYGTESCPLFFDGAFAAALTALGGCQSGGTIRLYEGTYNQYVLIANPMTLEAVGGPALISP